MSTAIDDNTYPIWYFNWEQDTVEGSMTVIGGKVQEEALWGTIATSATPALKQRSTGAAANLE